jgi:hypothetical protein
MKFSYAASTYLVSARDLILRYACFGVLLKSVWDRRQDLPRRQRAKACQRPVPSVEGDQRSNQQVQFIYILLVIMIILYGKMAEWLWRVTQANFA